MLKNIRDLVDIFALFYELNIISLWSHGTS